MKKIAALALLLALVGCGGGQEDTKPSPVKEAPDSDAEYVALIHEEAPSWEVYSDEELVQFMERSCDGDMLTKEAKKAKVSDEDLGYLIGLAMTTVCD